MSEEAKQNATNELNNATNELNNVTNELNKSITLEDVKKQLDSLDDAAKERFAETVKKLQQAIENAAASHQAVIDTKQNKYGAYFFRAVEIVTFACVVYSVVNHIF